MISKSLRLIVFVAAFGAMHMGCAGAPDDGAAEGAEGLEVDTDTPTVTQGRYTRDGATVGFRVALEGGARTIEIRSTTGETLLESTSDGTTETDYFFGGRLTVTGPIGSPEPMFDGDRAAFDELAARPEAGAIRNLRDALAAANARSLRDIAQPASASTTSQLMWNSGPYWYLNGGEERSFPTWTFWYPTNVELALHASNNYPPMVLGCVWLRAGAPAGEALCATWNELQTATRYYWGVWVNVRNMERWGDYVRIRVF
jgi:hypothetical protein